MSTGQDSQLERITVNLIPKTSAALRQATDLTRDSKTDTVNRAIQVYAWLMYLTANGGEIRVREDAGGDLSLVKFV